MVHEPAEHRAGHARAPQRGDLEEVEGLPATELDDDPLGEGLAHVEEERGAGVEPRQGTDRPERQAVVSEETGWW